MPLLVHPDLGTNLQAGADMADSALPGVERAELETPLYELVGSFPAMGHTVRSVSSDEMGGAILMAGGFHRSDRISQGRRSCRLTTRAYARHWKNM